MYQLHVIVASGRRMHRQQCIEHVRAQRGDKEKRSRVRKRERERARAIGAAAKRWEGGGLATWRATRAISSDALSFYCILSVPLEVANPKHTHRIWSRTYVHAV